MKTRTKYAIAILIYGIALIACVLIFQFFGNRQIFDTHNRFNRAIIELPNGKIIDGSVDSWKDFEDGDQLQVTIQNVTYLVHSTNCVLINE